MWKTQSTNKKYIQVPCFLLQQFKKFVYVFCPQRFYKKAAAFVLRAVAKHSPQLAQVCRKAK